jgi:hypothetical protein
MDRSPRAAEALRRIGLLYAIEREIRGQPPEVRAHARFERSAPILAEFRERLINEQRSLSAKSQLAAAIQYTLSRWTALTGYLEDGRLEVDNNAAERAIGATICSRARTPAARRRQLSTA